MKVNTFKEYPMTADVWVLFQQDEDSGDIVYNYSRPIRCRFITDGARKTLLAPTGLQEFNQIRNIKDVNGTEISPGDIYVVKALVPVVNVFGYSEEMSYSLSGV